MVVEELVPSVSNNTVVLFLVGIHPKVARTPKTAAHKNHPNFKRRKARSQNSFGTTKVEYSI